ncbi:hypothetical protein PQJ75_03920 [Rhodoplanes sp. TEM]|uniref:Uncharacterized protein n=1 Tax=Rhodoplanes tepidamans TaxID=200616 RepID=A0ABT5JC79_RHOTP|nr:MULTISPECIES: hypothetical protein [Rhodoplanes]MDC7786981.1 hypothetical protein [Rhodoplanes tepidamans]MDC7982864.1 hypothetical protein [Rhodoplanes sp. TEM]MDQ0354295.1 hypothetical protein [Rhodoplanes tepidamans]
MHPVSPSADDEAADHRLAEVRRRSDRLWTLLFCVGSCLDVLAEAALELEARDAQALQDRIAGARERTAEVRRRLQETERLLGRRACAPPDDVVWRFEA